LKAAFEQAHYPKRQNFAIWIAGFDTRCTAAVVKYLMEKGKLLWACNAIESHGAASHWGESTGVGFQASIAMKDRTTRHHTLVARGGYSQCRSAFRIVETVVRQAVRDHGGFRWQMTRETSIEREFGG
jgi:hypothetical protein